MIRKVILILFILGVVITLATCGISYFEKRISSPPVEPEARYVISAGFPMPTQIYYSDSVIEDGNSVTLFSYWLEIDGKWQQQEGELILDREAWGKITVGDRR